MSKLETNTIDTVSGTTNLTIGSTNSSTVTFENGAPTGHMYPAFEAYLSADQSLTSNTDTKVQFNTEVYDTDSDYDNSTNYRFTPTVAGKYYVYARIRGDSSGTNNVQRVITYIYKNGSQVISARDYTATGTPSNSMTPVAVGIIDMNGSSDYLEAYINVLATSGTPSAVGGSTLRYSNFGAYRIGA